VADVKDGVAADHTAALVYDFELQKRGFIESTLLRKNGCGFSHIPCLKGEDMRETTACFMKTDLVPAQPRGLPAALNSARSVFQFNTPHWTVTACETLPHTSAHVRRSYVTLTRRACPQPAGGKLSRKLAV
jgi:hypothetical protein